MSGRRSSSSDGTPTGISGSVATERRARDRERRGRLADQHRDRVLELRALDADVDRLRLRALELRLRLHDVDARRDAGGVAVLRELERALVRRDRFLEHAALHVGDAQAEIALRHGGLGGQAHRFEIGRARLPVRLARLDRRGAPCPTGRAPSSH